MDAFQILIVDDDRDLTAMLSQYLVAEGYRVDVLHTGEEAVSAAVSGLYDAVILDVMLPRMSGTEALRRIRQVSDVLVIMLTAQGDKADRTAGLETGADDYIAKPYHPPELVARLKAVLRRRVTRRGENPASVVQLGNLRLDADARRAMCDARELELTSSEFVLLLALVRAGETVVTKDDLSLQVLRRPREPYDRSLDVHVSNIRQKLSALRNAPTIEAVRGVGYRLVPRP